MALADYLEAVEHLEVSIDITAGRGETRVPWSVRLRRISRADLLDASGQVGRFMAEGELDTRREGARGMVTSGETDKAEAAAQIQDRIEARMLTASRLHIQAQARERLEGMEAAVRLSVVAIDTDDGAGWEDVQLLRTGDAPLASLPGVGVELSRLPAAFTALVWPHVQRWGTDQAREVAAVAVRFRHDAERARTEGDKPAPVNACDGSASPATGGAGGGGRHGDRA